MYRLTAPVVLAGLLMAVSACEKSTESTPTTSAIEKTQPKAVQSKVATDNSAKSSTENSLLDKILGDQPAETQARYAWRHPKEVLNYFGIRPGMTVVEVLPGGGWYSKILLPLLGSEGRLIGMNYPQDIWPKFGFFSEERLAAFKVWKETWPSETAEWGIANSAPAVATEMGSIPENLEGSADAVLFIRALHNMARFNADGGYMGIGLADTVKLLKPGGIVGVVQHEARPEMSDEWAGGQNGYVKKDFIVKNMVAAGLEFLGEIDANENPKDRPAESDIVWRLPPGLSTSHDKPELREKMSAIGESNRMTLKFRKPG